MKTLGERNNNPLNIRRVAGQRWKGEVLPSIQGGAGGGSLPSIQGGDGGGSFVRFETIEFGLRAAFVLLRTYSAKYHANCVRDIISRWAPPSENDTEAYIRSVCTLTGFGGQERLTEAQWPALVKAMALIESRMHLDEGILKTAYNLYLQLKINN